MASASSQMLVSMCYVQDLALLVKTVNASILIHVQTSFAAWVQSAKMDNAFAVMGLALPEMGTATVEMAEDDHR